MEKGVVNRGFSEEENISDTGVSYNPFRPKNNENNLDSTNSNNMPASETSTAPKTDTTQHKRAVDNFVAENNWKPFSNAPALLPVPFEAKNQNQNNIQQPKVSNNVQKLSMLPGNVEAEAASKIVKDHLPSNNITSEIKKSSLSDRRLSKEYFRDVRLSLDASKPITPTMDNGSLPFHSNSFSSRKNFSIQSSSASNSESSCDNCVRRSIEQYKPIFKHLVQRPLFCFSLWAMFYIFWGDDALPGGSLFALTILELAALFLGYVAEILQLPGLLGMVVAGLVLRNVPYIDVAKDLELSVSSPLRVVSIVILLVRGALGVNPVNIVKFKNIILSLVIGSCVLEAAAASIAVYFILDFPVEWAALMGCIISAMSGVAVLPYLASTEKQFSAKADPSSLSPHYQSVITMARTACGLDAMIAICMAEVALGFIFADGDVGMGVVKGAVEVVMGGVFGIVWGLLAGYLLDETTSSEKRSMTIFSCGVMSLMGFPKIGYPRAGPLAVFTGVLITSTIWKKRRIGGNNNEELSAMFNILWYIFQPLLFAIIGARTDFEMVDWTIVWKGLICMAISALIRMITAFTTLTTTAGELTLREKIYMCIAWIPKGTVQAALGPAAIDTVFSSKDLKSPDAYEDLGYKVMNLSTVSFIVAATIGCLCLRFLGPRLLLQK